MGRKQLVREIKRTALARMEDSARTEEDFREVVAQWNHLDKNRERRERYHEIQRSNEDMLHWDKINEDNEKGRIKEGLETVVPRPFEHQWWRQQLRGDFIDTIFDCPYELHELVGDMDIFPLLRDLSENHREILYYSAVRQYSNVRIANIRKQTDRNIRKTLALLVNKLRDKLVLQLRQRLEIGLSITPRQRDFLTWYDEQKKAAAIDSGGDQ